jgi:hypothetical protein
LYRKTRKFFPLTDAVIENVSVRYPSRKVGVAIQLGSHRVERALLYEMVHDPDVLE